jgi:hypothetical protein
MNTLYFYYKKSFYLIIIKICRIIKHQENPLYLLF